jgi:hypothetical protein
MNEYYFNTTLHHLYNTFPTLLREKVQVKAGRVESFSRERDKARRGKEK